MPTFEVVVSASPIDFATGILSTYLKLLRIRAGAPQVVMVNSIMAGSKSPITYSHPILSIKVSLVP